MAESLMEAVCKCTQQVSRVAGVRGARMVGGREGMTAEGWPGLMITLSKMHHKPPSKSARVRAEDGVIRWPFGWVGIWEMAARWGCEGFARDKSNMLIMGW